MAATEYIKEVKVLPMTLSPTVVPAKGKESAHEPFSWEKTLTTRADPFFQVESEVISAPTF
jgi:hypothetical protein